MSIIATAFGHVETVHLLYLRSDVMPDPIVLSEVDFLAFQKDPEHTVARLLGLSLHEFRDWMASDGCVRCAHINAAGRRCQKSVSGGAYQPRDWLAAQGTCCVQHGGPTGLECRSGARR
jgi:hypothetical protein